MALPSTGSVRGAKCNGMKEVENEPAIAWCGRVLRALAERAEGLGFWKGSWCEARARGTVAPCAGGKISNYKIILIIYNVLKRY